MKVWLALLFFYSNYTYATQLECHIKQDRNNPLILTGEFDHEGGIYKDLRAYVKIKNKPVDESVRIVSLKDSPSSFPENTVREMFLESEHVSLFLVLNVNGDEVDSVGKTQLILKSSDRETRIYKGRGFFNDPIVCNFE